MSNPIQAAPLLSPQRTKGATLYTFSTTTADYGYLLSQSSIKVVPSKFVALKLPKWSNTTDQHIFVDETDIGEPFNTDPNWVLPKTIQDYIENQLSYSEASRTTDTLTNYSEAAFWKMLQKYGGMEMVDTGRTLVESGKTKKIYREAEATPSYDPIVKFVGTINLLSHVKTNGVEYTKVGLHIPTSAGYVDNVTFKMLDVDHVSGLIPVETASSTTYGLEDYIGTQSVSALFDDQLNKKYAVGSDETDLGIYFSDILSDQTRLNKGDFTFNAMLVYYDIFDADNRTNYATNAYGIWFMNHWSTLTAGSGTMDGFKKYMPDTIQAGNAFIEELNLKFANYSTQTTSEISINNYSTVSMELYMKALNMLTDIQATYEKQTKQLIEQQAIIDQFSQYIFNASKLNASLSTIDTLVSDVSKLKTWQTGTANIRISNEELFAIFQSLTTQLQSGAVINAEMIVSPKLHFPSVVDETQFLVEDANGVRYRWDTQLKMWVAV